MSYRDPENENQFILYTTMIVTVLVLLMSVSTQLMASIRPHSFYTEDPSQYVTPGHECTSLSATKSHNIEIRKSYYCYTIPEFENVWFVGRNFGTRINGYDMYHYDTVNGDLNVVEVDVVFPREDNISIPQEAPIAETPIPSAIVMFMSVCAGYLGFRLRKRYV